jgi:hypothetical protein
MNEQAIIDSYNLFVQSGYKKSLPEYKQLIASNPNALNDSFDLFKQNGYSKSLDEYKSLMGVDIDQPSIKPVDIQEFKKKEDTTELPLEDGGSVLQPSKRNISLFKSEELKIKDQAASDATIVANQKIEPIESVPEKKQTYVENLFTNLGLGASYFNEAIASIPESAINLLAIPQNYIAEKTGWDIGVTAEGIKESWGITNPLLDYVKESQEVLNGTVNKFIADRYEDPSIVGNFQKGNYQDGFELLGSAITQSVPVSIGLMIGGAYTTPSKLATIATVGFTENQREELAEMDPTMSEAEKTLKAGAMAAAESVFSAIGTGTIGKVYKDIAKREGTEAAKGILKDGLVLAYKKALEKGGALTGFVGDGIEEAATQITQNVISGRPAFEGAADAFVTGAGSGVVFTAPISAYNAKKYIDNKVQSYQTKDKIGQILGDKADNIDNLYNTPVSSDISSQQLEIAILPNSRNILENRLKKSVLENKITENDAKQSLFVFDKIQQVSNAVKDLDVSVEDKSKIATLLKKRDDLKTKIQNKDDVLVVQEKKNIEEINNQIQEILSAPKKEKASYKVDGKEVAPTVIDDLLKTKSKEELLAMNIQIENDTEGRIDKFQEIINSQSETTPDATKRRERIVELLKVIEDDNTAIEYNTSNKLPLEEKNKIIEEVKALKAEEDAVQKQATSQVPVQSGAGVSQEVSQGLTQAEPQVTTQEGIQEEVVAKTTQDIKSEIDSLREQEQAELSEAIPNSDQYKVDGVIDGEKITDPADKKIFEEIYNKYDKLISPLLEQQKTEEVSSKTQENVVIVDSPKEGIVEEVVAERLPGFNEGVAQVQENASEYKKIVDERNKQTNPSSQPSRTNIAVPKLFTKVSKMISDAYESVTNQPNREDVKRAYDALVRETKDQYEFIKSKGLKIVKHEGTGEPYANSKEMLSDLRDNNTLKFLPNEVAFGQGDTDVSDNIGLQPSGIKLEDGYELTNSEVFRVVHDYFGHGILGNQFGAIGEENATLQHLDLYSDEAAPAVVFQTRGQNSWVNFSGANARANELRKQARELKSQGKTKEAESLLQEADKIFKFAEPKIGIFPTKFNFKRYETARRINEQETIDSRPNKRTDVLSRLLEKYSKRSSGKRGVDKRDVRRTESIRGNDVTVIAEYTLDNAINEGIKKSFPNFQGVQKILEITNGDAYRRIMIESLQGNPFASSVTVHTPEQFNEMRMFITEDGATGITMTKEGFLGGAFSTSNKPNNLAQLMVLGIKEGATTAEAFDTVLPDYYSKFGLKAVSRTEFNDDYRPQVQNGNTVADWDYNTYKKFNNGRPDVVFFIYDGGDRNTIEDRIGLFDLYKNYEKENTESFDKDGYENAEEVMKQSAVKRLEFELGIDQNLETQETDQQTQVPDSVEGVMDELLSLDPKESGTAQKIIDGIDNLLKEYEQIEKKGLNVGIALPAIKAILKGIRSLVQAGMNLNDAIKKAAQDNNVTVRDIVNGINAVSQIAPIQGEYDALMTKADKLIKRQKSRGITDKKILSNLEAMIRKSDVYTNANDTQRKIMETEVRDKMGVGPRKSASIGRVIGVLKDITNVTRKEKLKIISRIRELSRDVAKDLTNEIRELAKEGKISATQAVNIISKLGKVNMLNEISVSNFVDYMAKVFADADYDNKINVATGKLKNARKNVASKIGIADGLMLPLQRLFSVDPSMIPEAYLDKYLELVDMFSARQAVLTLSEKSSVKKDVDQILNEINNEQSRADELAEMFAESDNKVFDEDNLDYSASLKKMASEGEITDEDLKLMKKYKQEILPQVDTVPLSEEEVNNKKSDQISEIKKVSIDSSGLPSQDEINLANRLAKLIKNTSEKDLMKLSTTDLKNLLKVADNINKNYLPHYAQIMVEKINAINSSKTLISSIKKAIPLNFSAVYSRIKSAIIRSQKGALSEMVRRNPLFNIDQVFGDFKTKDIFNSLFEKAAEGEANFKAEIKKVQNILEKAEAKVAKSFNLDPNKTLISKFKMMTYMIQLEYDSNKGSEQVNPAADYLKETIKHIDSGKSRFGERDANMLQEILKEFAPNGDIDINKLFNSFNQAEKDAINDIRKINESLKDKAQYTAAIIRGDAIDPLNNYVHLNVLHDTQPLDASASMDFLNQANNSRKPSTKAKSLISRTKGAKPLNFDVFASAQRGAKFVLLDYNLTEPIRTARRTINMTTQELGSQGRLSKTQREVKSAIENAFEETLENLLTNSILQNSLADDAIDFISKQGYRAVLAGTGRFAAELTSNVSFALLADPKAFNSGFKYKDIIMSTDAPLIMENVNSKQTNRIFPSDTLSGKFIDTSILSQASGIQGSNSKNPVFNKIQQAYNLTGKKLKNGVELVADTLISTPDKIIMRPMWFGSFANEFKSLTGKNVDFKKIAANDQSYMESNKDAIDQAKKIADQKSVFTGATDNSFMGILKGTVKPNQSVSTRAFNNFNNYMTRFLIFEYVTARTAIYALAGDGTITKTQGAALLAAVTTRMTVYTLLSQMLASGIMGLLGVGDEDEEDEKSLMQKIGQSLTSTFTSLLIGRDFGNATKLVINYGLEEINEKYLDFLREGDYDPYKDGIAYSLIPREETKKTSLSELLINMGGSFTPALKTASLIVENMSAIPEVLKGGTTKKEADAIEREERVVKERIPLEVFGHMGYIPFYKDVRRVVNKSIYASINEAKKSADRKKDEQKELLGGYENKTDLKRYNPKLYEKNFGEKSEYYKKTKDEREKEEAEDKLNREIKDRIYNYKPEDEGFGSSGFGKKEKRKNKSSKGFGSEGFGKD